MIYFVSKKVTYFFPKKLKSERRSKMDSSPHNYCALLCALSVGAAIVIARPNDAPKRSDSTEQQQFRLFDTATVETETDSPSTWQKTQSEVKNFAQKSFDFGKRITFKTANVSANFIESIGDSLTTIIQ